MKITKLLLVMLCSIAVAACGGGGEGGGGSTGQVYTGTSLSGATANGVALGGRLIAPVTVGSHTYYYWDASGDGTSAGGDVVSHDLLDQIFNGGTLGDSAKDTSDATVNTVTLSNGVRIHLPTIAELSALYAHTGWTHTGWSGLFWSASQVSSGASPAGPGFHDVIMDSNGSFVNVDDTQTLNVVFEVLGAASANISATANTTAQSLTVNTAMASFSPLTASGGATPYTYSYTGTLPTGLSFSTSTGAVTGTPTTTYATASLVFSVKDANNVVASTTSNVSFTVGMGGGGSSSSPFAGNWSGNWSHEVISNGMTCSWAGTWSGTIDYGTFANGLFTVRSTPVFYTGNPSSCGSMSFGFQAMLDSSGTFSWLMGCNGGIGGTGSSGNGFPYSGTFYTSPRSVSGSVYCSGVYLGVSYQITEAFLGN